MLSALPSQSLNNSNKANKLLLNKITRKDTEAIARKITQTMATIIRTIAHRSSLPPLQILNKKTTEIKRLDPNTNSNCPRAVPISINPINPISINIIIIRIRDQLRPIRNR